MKTLLTVAAGCLALSLPAVSGAADKDVFSGIYSTIDPHTGAEVDMLKIQKFLDDGYTVFINAGAWSGPNEGKIGEPSEQWAMPGPFPHDPKVVTLSVEGLGALYQLPQGVFSRAGKSETGYLTHMVQLGTIELKRRPLVADHQERGERGVNDYQPQATEQKVEVSALNYSGKNIQIGLSAASNKKNAVDTDPLHPYMSSVPSCCFYLPKTWNASLRVNVEYRSLPDGKLTTVPLAVPKYDSPRTLWVAVQPDGRMEISFPKSYLDDDKQRTMPAPPPAERAAIQAWQLKRYKEAVADLSQQLKKSPESVRNQFREDLIARRQMVRYTEVLNACTQARKQCEMEAQAQAKDIH
ncbi:hypothetical protein [Duganella sp. S19_KUP01_CR8]|uniref:hypothetical protein n=1 Tax=Duganella sp. S19_KUP01_CR8 TaxID=3025502 RepID=UPI002FCDE196